MEITITKKISKEVIESVIVTALEGGSNYWYMLPNHCTQEIRKHVTRKEEECLSVAFTSALYKGAELPVYDVEEGDCLGIVSMKTMQPRLQTLADDENYRWALDNELAGDGDAESSDVVFQFLVMNKVDFS